MNHVGASSEGNFIISGVSAEGTVIITCRRDFSAGPLLENPTHQSVMGINYQAPVIIWTGAKLSVVHEQGREKRSGKSSVFNCITFTV